MTKNKKNEGGFTLVETLVAVAILMLVIVGPMRISTQVSRSSNFSNEQVVAFFLAQEGLELAQKMRDDATLDDFSNGWANFKNSSEYSTCTGGCGLQVGQTSEFGGVKNCSAGNTTNCRLYYNDSTDKRDRYIYGLATNYEITPYTRIVKFNEVDADQVEVTSTVTWRTGFLRAEQKFESKTYLFNVYK